MSDSEVDTSLVGLSWEVWRRATHLDSTVVTPKVRHDVAAMPSQKAICYGFCPSNELGSMTLITCEKCGMVLKDVGYGYHMRSQHGYEDSDSDDDCQSFLLSPPHRSVSPCLESPILSPPYRRLSNPVVSSKESSGRNGNIISQATSTGYSVKQKNNLKLSLRVSRRNARSEENVTNNSTKHHGAKKVDITTKVDKHLNGAVVKKKERKRKRDSSHEDNFSSEHSRQKKHSSVERQSDNKESEPVSRHLQNNGDDSKFDNDVYIGRTPCSQHNYSHEVDLDVPAMGRTNTASPSLLKDTNVQLESVLEENDSIERLEGDGRTTYDAHTRIEAESCSGQCDSDLVLNFADSSGDLGPYSWFSSEKDVLQQNWAENTALLEDPNMENHLAEDPDLNRFYVPSPPHLSPALSGRYSTNLFATSKVTPDEVCHDQMQGNMVQPRERIIPVRYGVVPQPSSLNANQDLNMFDDALREERYVGIDSEEHVDPESDGHLKTLHHNITEKLVPIKPCLYNYPQQEILDDNKNGYLQQDQFDYMVNDFWGKSPQMVQQTICLPHQQAHPRVVSVAVVPQKKNMRICSLILINFSSVSCPDDYIDPEQKIYYPNARLLTVPINGRTTVGYPSQTKFPSPDVFSKHIQGVNDLSSSERVPQVSNFHCNMMDRVPREKRTSMQSTDGKTERYLNHMNYDVQGNYNHLLLGENPALKIPSSSVSQHLYSYNQMPPTDVCRARSSSYMPYVAKKKVSSRHTVRSHANSAAQRPVASEVTPHEVYVPIHGKTVIRPEYRYVYIPTKSSRFADRSQLHHRHGKDHSKETNEFGCREARRLEHQSRTEPTMRQVTIQKVHPGVSHRVRSSTLANDNMRCVKRTTHNAHHFAATGIEANTYPVEASNCGTNVIVHGSSKDHLYQSQGLRSYPMMGSMQRNNIASKSRHKSSCNSCRVQQHTDSRQMHKTKVIQAESGAQKLFGADHVGTHLMKNGMKRDCSSFTSVENHPNVAVPTAHLRNASHTDIRSDNGRAVTIVPVPVLKKCSNSSHYKDSYEAIISSSPASHNIIPLTSFTSGSHTY
ncbi:unnamed protein product [Thelazia callipaeda]|uniref:C2H2-type domain-containing protein n=1 Tax=Thelazia callipaeda TaxID=103827 RepID=A0A0N5CUM1_THECL|nr:unnamed protein product [Thelazia callipaeda]